MGDLLVEPSPMLSSMVVYTLVGSALGFQCYNSALNFVPAPEKYASEKRFKWRNVMTSFVHALISGSVAVYCFLRWPEASADMINFSNSLMELMVALSVGYFTYDLLDLLYYKGFQSSWSLVLHHVVIMGSFSIALCTHKYIGYAICALIGEVNSIFLHARQLMLMMNYSKSCSTYKLNGVVNIVTFIIFRFGIMYHMSCWLYNHTPLIPPVLVGVASFGLLSMVIINIVLFYRLIQSDYLQVRNNDAKGNQDILSN